MTSAPRSVVASSVAPQPWKNGGGRTRELFAWPDRERWRARVSLADIETDGPFSPFPGVVRWFAVLAGAGVELVFESGRVRIAPGDAPLRFDGALTPMCRLLDGPTRDLNLMLRDADGAMVRAADHRPWSPAGDACGLFAAVRGTLHADRRPLRVETETLVWFDTPPPVLRFAADQDSGSPVGWWLQFTARGA